MSLLASSSGRWLAAFLAVSLSLNLVAAGYWLGKEQRWRQGPRAAPPHTQVGRFLRSLSEQRRGELKPLARQYWHSSRASMRGLVDSRSRLNEILSSNPLDQDAVTEAMAAVDAALLQSSRRSQQALLALIQELTAEERQALARSAHRSGRHKGPGGRMGPGGGPHRRPN